MAGEVDAEGDKDDPGDEDNDEADPAGFFNASVLRLNSSSLHDGGRNHAFYEEDAYGNEDDVVQNADDGDEVRDEIQGAEGVRYDNPCRYFCCLGAIWVSDRKRKRDDVALDSFQTVEEGFH